MHIGFDISQTGSGKAGCGYYAHSMLQALLDINSKHQFSLFPSFGDFYFDPFMPLYNPYKLGNYGPRHLTRHTARQFWQQTEVESRIGAPDILHSNNFWCPRQCQKSRIVYTFYDMGFLINPNWTPRKNWVGCFRGVFQASIAADWIVAISEASKKHFLETFPHYPAERVTVIYPCSRFWNTEIVSRMPSINKLISTSRFWLSVGTIEPRKNQRFLARAYARYLSLGGDPIPLVFAGGEGWLMEGFKEELKQLNILDHVIFTGYVSDETLIWLYQHCYANLYPSLFEGFGLPILEGMQFGAPTVSSNTTSLPEISGSAGILLSPEDCEAWAQTMFRLSQHEEERNNLAASAKIRASQFDWKRSASSLFELYNEVMQSPKVFQ